MHSVFVGGALATTGLFERIWSYNRENYMWDGSNRQSRAFQLQNMAVNRFGLFREDIRDLAALTTNKMDSYLVVNTLKLGFIVTSFFSFSKKTSECLEGQKMLWLLLVLMSLFFLTGFMFLLTSVWFAMHANVLAQGLMTKMLVQTVRIPLPTQQNIKDAVPEAREFEVNISDALRLPGASSGRPAAAAVTTLGSGESDPVSRTLSRSLSSSRYAGILGGGPAAGGVMGRSLSSSSALVRRRSSMQPGGEMRRQLSLGPAGTGARRDSKPQLPVFLEDPEESTAAQQSDVDKPAASGNLAGKAAGASVAAAMALGMPNPAVWAAAAALAGGQDSGSAAAAAEEQEPDLVETCVDAQDNIASLPHLKLYRQLMQNWVPYDYYCKLCMTIGTSSMLSGFGLFAVYYSSRQARGGLYLPDAGGWFTFFLCSVLAWWSATLDLVLKTKEQILLALTAMGGPLSFTVACFWKSQWEVFMRLTALLYCAWVWLLLAWAGPLSGPTRWRAALFLDVFANVPLETSPEDTSCEASAARRASAVLLKFLDAVLSDRYIGLLSAAECASARRALGQLIEAAEQAGCLDASQDVDGIMGDKQPTGFWIVLDRPPAGGQHDEPVEPPMHWIELLTAEPPMVRMASAGTDSSAGVAEAQDELGGCAVTTFSELLETAQKSAERLLRADKEQAQVVWTELDRELLAQYGGLPCDGVLDFEAQFRTKGLDATRPMGATARRFFELNLGVAFTGWLLAFIYCCNGHRPHDADAVPAAAASMLSTMPARRATVLSRESLRLPRSWFHPSSLTCDDEGRRLAVSDGVRAYVHDPDLRWSMPLAAPDGGHAAAVAFRPDGTAVVMSGADIYGLGLAQLPRSASMREGAKLDVLALDPSPRRELPGFRGAGDVPRGLLARGGELFVLEEDSDGNLAVAGTLQGPFAGQNRTSEDSRRWVALALRAGRGLALDDRGRGFSLDLRSALWEGPWLLGADAAETWHGLCLLPDGRSWLALREGLDDEDFEVFRFGPPEELKVAAAASSSSVVATG
eukprot:TRINITY_DN22586_c0_g1_i1.p1 TRINITY_DN22586_c0_g1~~TRINITY_DN22586_c0_g1_i1.p1  ORF type:complete len:1031 (+),score=217.70 TRINITY_DN22586_c0_g1_i1:104-3196(+)